MINFSLNFFETNIFDDDLPESNPKMKAPMEENMAQMTLIHAIWNLGRVSSMMH